jgi:uncharacterized membrane protein YeaQ/YmgE (transglycosylase-associated protein family)
MINWGAVCFGLVVGWVTYRTMRRSKTNGLSDIATIIGAVGGAAVTTLFPTKDQLFYAYCIGLAVGFFTYLAFSGYIDVKAATKPELKPFSKWLGGDETELPEPTTRRVVPPPGD